MGDRRIWTRRIAISAVAVSALGVTVSIPSPSLAAQHQTSLAAEHQTSTARATPGRTYRAITPRTIVDTRTGIGTRQGPVAGRSVRTVQLTGKAGIPANAYAVALDVRVLAGDSKGSLAVYSATGVPRTRLIDFAAGQRISNLDFVRPNTRGLVHLYNSARTPIDITIEAVGYFTHGSAAAGSFVSVPQQRVFDSTPDRTSRYLEGKGSTTIHTGLALHGSGIRAAVVVIHIFSPHHAHGAILAHAEHYYPNRTAPTDEPVLHFTGWEHIAALAVVPVGLQHDVTLKNTSRSFVDAAVDVLGYFRTTPTVRTGGYHAVTPHRILSTETGLGTAAHPFAAGDARSVTVDGRNGLPANGIRAVLVTVHAVSPTAPGSLRAASSTAASSGHALDYAVDRTVATSAVIPLHDGRLTLRNDSPGRTDVDLDIRGYFYAAPPKTVTGLTVGEVAANAVTLSWTTPTTSSVTGIAVRRGPLGSPPSSPTAGVAVADLGPRATTFTDYGVAAAGGYSYAVFTHDAIPHFGAPKVRVATTTAAPPGAPWGERQLVDPAIGNPRDISCVSATFCLAVDSFGNVVSYNGSTWSPPARVHDGALYSIACVSTSWCIAGTETGDIRTFDGTSWGQPVSLGTVAPVLQLTCASTQLCLAAVANGPVYAFNGSSWTAASDDGYALAAGAALSCAPATTRCVGLSRDGTWSTFDAGGDWSTPAKIDGETFDDIACPTATFCMAGAFSGAAYEFDGSTWTSDGIVGQDLTTVSCASASFCAAVNDGALLKFVDGAWQTTGRYLQTFQPTALSCPVDGWCASIDFFRGSAMVGADTSPTDIDAISGGVVALTCLSASFCAMVDKGRRFLTYDGVGWTATTATGVPDYYSYVPPALTCASDTHCFEVRGGAIADILYANGHWSSTVEVLDDAGVSSGPSCPDADHCFLVAGFGRVWQWVSGVWQKSVKFREESGPYYISCWTATSCVAVAGDHMWRMAGSTWTKRITVPGIARFGQLRCTSGRFCVAVADGGVTRFDGTRWSSVVHPSGESINGLSCVAGHCTAITSLTGDGFSYDGRSWTAAVNADPDRTQLQRLDAVSCATTELCVVGDLDGAVIFRT